MVEPYYRSSPSDRIVLTVVFVVFVAVQSWWLRESNDFLNSESLTHLAQACNYAHRIVASDENILRSLDSSENFVHRPLLYLLTFPFLRLFPGNILAPFFLNALFFLAFVWLHLFLTRSLFGQKTAILSLAILLSLPPIWGMFRYYNIDVLLVVYCQINLAYITVIAPKHTNFRSILIIAVLVLIGSEIKISFPIYTAPVYLFFLSNRTRHPLLLLVTVPLVACAIAFYLFLFPVANIHYLVDRLDIIIKYLLGLWLEILGRRSLHPFALMPLHRFLMAYAYNIYQGILPILALILPIAYIHFLRRSGHRRMLAISSLMSFMALNFIAYRRGNYLLPLYPVWAIMIAELMSKYWLGRATIIPIILVNCLICTSLSTINLTWLEGILASSPTDSYFRGYYPSPPKHYPLPGRIAAIESVADEVAIIDCRDSYVPTRLYEYFLNIAYPSINPRRIELPYYLDRLSYFKTFLLFSERRTESTEDFVRGCFQCQYWICPEFDIPKDQGWFSPPDGMIRIVHARIEQVRLRPGITMENLWRRTTMSDIYATSLRQYQSLSLGDLGKSLDHLRNLVQKPNFDPTVIHGLRALATTALDHIRRGVKGWEFDPGFFSDLYQIIEARLYEMEAEHQNNLAFQKAITAFLCPSCGLDPAGAGTDFLRLFRENRGIFLSGSNIAALVSLDYLHPDSGIATLFSDLCTVAMTLPRPGFPLLLQTHCAKRQDDLLVREQTRQRVAWSIRSSLAAILKNGDLVPLLWALKGLYSVRQMDEFIDLLQWIEAQLPEPNIAIEVNLLWIYAHTLERAGRSEQAARIYRVCLDRAESRAAMIFADQEMHVDPNRIKLELAYSLLGMIGKSDQTDHREDEALALLGQVLGDKETVRAFRYEHLWSLQRYNLRIGGDDLDRKLERLAVRVDPTEQTFHRSVDWILGDYFNKKGRTDAARPLLSAALRYFCGQTKPECLVIKEQYQDFRVESEN